MKRTLSTLAFALVEDVWILVHGAEPPSDADWEIWAETLETGPGPRDATVVITPEGVAPNAKQRIRISRIVEGRDVRTAVVTDAISARAVITAMSWFNPGIRGFPTAALREALVHVGARAIDYEAFERTVAELEATLR